ncbi:MAG: asparaginase domain-containing protein [Candidatus Woesearchaeota archaeon]|nr:asparaginase domain-containing protein [Candidatus Woesearchaeota archaeon]
MVVKIFTTGGTIDKDYSAEAGVYNFEIAEPAIRRILDNVNPNFPFEIVSILRKDSLDLTEEDRQKIYDSCKNEASDKIIITHGTDTMVETAKKLSAIKNKVIILVGSSKPAKFSDSDASFNIGTAIGVLNILNNGVYIAMNGGVCAWDNVRKNKKTGKFETIK